MLIKPGTKRGTGSLDFNTAGDTSQNKAISYWGAKEGIDLLFLKSCIVEINTSYSKCCISQLFCTVNVSPHETQVKLQTNIPGKRVLVSFKPGMEDVQKVIGFPDNK